MQQEHNSNADNYDSNIESPNTTEFTRRAKRGLWWPPALVIVLLLIFGYIFGWIPMMGVCQVSERVTSQNKLKTMALAMHGYHDVHKTLPSAALTDENEKPLLSWRVAILPYLEEKELYDRFNLKEPWDSDHNKKLLDQMPTVYAVSGESANSGLTHYQVFVGPGTAFERPGISLQNITHQDGTSRTILIVETDEAVPWTEPVNLKFGPNDPLPVFYRDPSTTSWISCILGTSFQPAFCAVFADGSSREISFPYEERFLRAIITRNGGEEIEE